jgi:hypothetical protein
MRINSICLLFMSVIVLNAITVSDPRWGGLQLQFTTRVEPGGTIGKGIGGGVLTGPDRPHRFICDAAEKRYFGYDLAVTPKGNSVFEVRIEPLGLGPERLKCGTDSSWTRLPLPTYPLVPAVRAGDTIAIDLLVNRSTGQKIVDYVSLRLSAFDAAVSSGETPRDFSLPDVQLTFREPRLSINGSPADAFNLAVEKGGVVGAVPWFYMADRGRFLMSLLPNESLGFRKAGVVAGDGLTFTADGAIYRIVCNSRMVPGEGVFNLYVLHDRPSDNPPDLSLGAADKVEYLVHK